MNTNEFGLTDQEIAEADGLIELYKTGEALRLRNVSIANAIEQIMLACYGSASEKTSDVANELMIVSKVIREIFANFDTGVELNESLKRLCITINNRYKSAGVISAFLMKSILANSSKEDIGCNIDASMPFFETNAARLDGVLEKWRNSLEEVRDKLKELRDSNKFVASLRQAVREWGSASEGRRLYLQSKGVHVIPLTASSCVSPVSGPSSVHRRRKKPCQPNLASITGRYQQEQSWQISILNSVNGNVLELAEILLSKKSDQEQLETMLLRQFNRPSSVKTAIKKLRDLVAMDPGNRAPVFSSMRALEKSWYCFRFSKYRVLIFVQDTEHKISIIAGHRTKIYGDLKLSHRE